MKVKENGLSSKQEQLEKQKPEELPDDSVL